MDNDCQSQIYDLIDGCQSSINGNIGSKDMKDGDAEKISLMAKKKEIMKSLNELVQTFNDND